MALELGSRVTWEAEPVETDLIGAHSRELHEWLSHLESWVETQLAATKALVAMLDDEDDMASIGGPEPLATVSARAR
jgi:hypothetical protein